MDPLFAQLLLNGLVSGAIYALLAAGLALIFGVLEVVNFAHGALYMLGAFVAYFLIPVIGYGPAIVASAACLAVVGLATYQGLLVRLPRDNTFSRSILITIGIAMVLENGAIVTVGARPRSVSVGIDLSAIAIGDVRLPALRLVAVVVAAACFIALEYVLHRTRDGKAMRGLSQNPDAALMVGISPQRVSRLAMMLGVGLAGVSGAVLAPIYSIDPMMGPAIVFKAFAIVVIGGMGSIPGAALVAVAIGVLESFAGGLGSTVIQTGLVFVVMILVLFIRPQGLFGKRVRV